MIGSIEIVIPTFWKMWVKMSAVIADDEKKPKLIARQKRPRRDTSTEADANAPIRKHAADESPLLADGGENVVVVHGGGGKKTELDLGVRRLESFARPTAGADRNERLIDRPGGALLDRYRD